MDRLPDEIHLKIYEYACLDNGTTGCSLSAVSKKVRRVSAEHRYQSIALQGDRQISRFLEVVRKVSGRMRRVRHMCLSDFAHQPRNLAAQPPVSNPTHGLLGGGALGGNAGIRMWEVIRVVSASVITLTLIAHNVYTEFVQHSDSSSARRLNARELRAIPLLSHSFPVLRELTLHGPYQLPRNTTFAPSLTHLHVNGEVLWHSDITETHPSLVCFRVSGVHEQSPGVAAVTALQLESVRSGKQDRRFILVEPRALPLVPRIPWRFKTCSTPSAEYMRMVEAFSTIQLHCPNFLFVPASTSHSQREQAETVRVQWLNRMCGGDGCWHPVRQTILDRVRPRS